MNYIDLVKDEEVITAIGYDEKENLDKKIQKALEKAVFTVHDNSKAKTVEIDKDFAVNSVFNIDHMTSGKGKIDGYELKYRNDTFAIFTSLAAAKKYAKQFNKEIRYNDYTE